MEIERAALVKDVPKEILFYAIEVIGEGLIEDAKSKFGDFPNFSVEMELEKVKPGPWVVKYRVHFSVYDYEFKWEIRDAKKGYLVRFVGKTRGKWWEPLFDVESKLEDLVDTQWSAFCNFAVGYMSAVSYGKARKRSEAREHVRKAKEKLGKTRKKKRK